ncbi:DUF2232 domain-containing protein [Gemmatimonadota bacterium]
MPETGSGGRLEWLRVAGLTVTTGAFSVLNPLVLVALPLALLVLVLPARRTLALVVGLVAGVLALGGNPGTGFWYLERAWALLLGGWFLALTLRWPGGRFLPRGLGAVAGAYGAMALLLRARPADWAVVDWAVTSRMESGVSLGMQSLRTGLGPDAISLDLEARLLEAVALQGLIFPALLGLASLAGLGVAWWLYVRLTRSPEPGLGPLRDFRFNDQLVWILILGFLVLLGSSGLWDRLGANAVVFMGALYALRGAAVLLFLTGGVSLLGGILLLLGMVFVAPFLIAGAFVIGLGDTWLNLRARRGAPSPS